MNSCSTATIAVNASCTINVIFSPIFSGPRSETISIIDDASNSPQIVNVFANASPAFTLTSPMSALSASVTAGQAATYNLQLTPGVDYSGTVSFTCTGAPLGTSCMTPSSVTLNTGSPASFTITVPTSGGALTLPYLAIRKLPRSPALPNILTLAFSALFVALVLTFLRDAAMLPPATDSQQFRWKRIYVIAALMLFAPLLFALEGCSGGGGNTVPAPAPPQGNSVVTPRGTSTLVLTPTAVSSSGKSLQLPPIQLTLTVK